MTDDKRFKLAYSNDLENDKWWAVRDGDITLWKEEVVYLLNTLHDENQSQKQIIDNLLDDLNNANRRNVDYKKRIDYLEEENQYLKQSNKDARHILEKEFDFASEQRQKHLDDPVVANAYDIIRFDIRKALDKLGDSE